MKKNIALSLCAVMTLSLLAGVGTSSVSATEADETARTLNVAWMNDMQTYDVHMTTNDYSIPLNVYDRLFEITIDDNNTAVLNNSLVTDYTISDDGLTFDFTLRDDVMFSDGTQLTANDVAYTFTRMVALTDSEQAYLFEKVEGYDDFVGTDNYHDEVLTGITVTDDTHFSMTLTSAYTGFLNILGSPACSIYSKAAVEAAGDAFGTDPAYAIGSGTYVLDTWTRDSGCTLSYNENYWGEKPDFTAVDIRVIPDADTLSLEFQSGKIDVLDCAYLDSAVVASVYKTAYADKIVKANRLGTTYMALNASSEALSDPVARKAVQMCIDRQSLVDNLENGDASLVDGIFPQGLIGFSEDNQGWLSYDPEGAAAMLEEAGYTKDADGYYFSFTIANDDDNSTSRQAVIMAIADMLQKNGINATVSNSDHSSWLASRKAGELDAYVSTWTADYNDPDNFISTFWGSEESTMGRSICYQDTDVMARVSAAPSIVDETERLAEYAALEKQIVETDASWVPLYQQVHLFVLSENVESFVPHWAGYSDFSFANCVAAN